MSSRIKIREEVSKLNPIDDLMFRKMSEDIEFCQEILQVFFNDRNLTVTDATPQWAGTNLQGRSVVLDTKCIVNNGNSVNIEVQKSDDDDHQKRVRYNGAILTTNVTDPGLRFEQVPDVSVVFISKFDIFNGNHSIYHINRVVKETGASVNNGFEEIYVNAAAKDNSEVSELMEVFVKDDVYNSKFPKTSALKRLYKKTEGGLNTMSNLAERLRMEGYNDGEIAGRIAGEKAGRIAGEKEGKIDFVRIMHAKGFDASAISDIFDVDINTVSEWLIHSKED